MIKPGLIASGSEFRFTIDESNVGMRIDSFLAQQFPYYSRTFFQQLITKNAVKINNVPITKPSVVLKQNDIVFISFPQKELVKPEQVEQLPIQIIFEHEHFFIINKPAGLLVHPPSVHKAKLSLIDWLIHREPSIKEIGYIDRPGIVHRLDMDTSGLLIIPRTNYAHKIFGEMFAKREIHKTYYAVVQGRPPAQGSINLSIGRDPVSRVKMIAKEKNFKRPGMRDALTNYKVLTYFDDAALVQAEPVTGRTHQIRVHLAAIGHPLIGDKTYGKKSSLIARHALHAKAISFRFEGQDYSFESPLPDDFITLLEQLESKKKTK